MQTQDVKKVQMILGSANIAVSKNSKFGTDEAPCLGIWIQRKMNKKVVIQNVFTENLENFEFPDQSTVENLKIYFKSGKNLIA